jgi:hypothetical protein
MDRTFLTPERRRRLRPAVDVAALERLLAAVPVEAHAGIVLACLAAVTPADLREAGLDGNDQVPAAAVRSGSPGGLSFVPVAHTDFIVQFDDPHLASLWAAVEPIRC